MGNLRVEIRTGPPGNPSPIHDYSEMPLLLDNIPKCWVMFFTGTPVHDPEDWNLYWWGMGFWEEVPLVGC